MIACQYQFFQERGFIYATTPIITASDAEGAGEMFRVTTGEEKEFFGKPANPLLAAGNASCGWSLQNVHTFGPTFRAENSNTARHAAEFWMIEPEIAFADLTRRHQPRRGFHQIHDPRRLRALPSGDEMAFSTSASSLALAEWLHAVAEAEFVRMTYTEAVALLEKSGHAFEYPVSWGIDLQSEHERFLTEEIVKGPVFLTDYPKDIKAFYMRANDDGKTVAAVDLLVPGIGEIIGGSQREERLDLLEARMNELGMPLDAYDWYLDLRRFGGVQHAGFGVGFERLLMYLSGMANIRDVIPFPRTPGSILF